MNRKLLYGLIGGGVALLAALVAAVPLLVPTTSLKGEIESRVSAATGRAFRIHGALTFSLFPSIGLDARDVTLANAPGGRARDMARIGRMRIAAKLWPLLFGKIEAGEVVLEKPVIALEVARGGAANWNFVREHAQSSGLRLPPDARFAGVRIEAGAVSYDNDERGIHRAIADLDATIDLASLDSPTGATGAFTLLGRKLNFASTITTPRALLAGRTIEAKLALTSNFLSADYYGHVRDSGTVTGYGTLRTPSLKDLAAWLGHKMSAGSGLGRLSARAEMMVAGDWVVLRDLKIELDAMTMRGELDVHLEPKVPTVNGSLDIDTLDLNTYLSLGAAQGGGPPRGGWSRTPVNLDLIKQLDGHLKLEVSALRLLRLHTGTTLMDVTFLGGLMTAKLGIIELYGGAGKADLTVDGRGPVPVIGNKVIFMNIAMRPFLADTIGVDKLDGRGTITLDVTSKGASPDAIMRALSGKGAVVIGRGSVRGVDMGQVARTVQTILSAGATGQSATTQFDRFGGSFSIQNGMLWNGDLKLESAFIHMKGAGHLDLGNQTIAYRIEPKASIGGRLNLLDVGVPFAITGPWSHVRYKPDLAGAVTGLVGGVLEKGTAPITGLFGALTGSGHAKPPPKKTNGKGPADTLKGIFGLH